jgi:hypothetical protein
MRSSVAGLGEEVRPGSCRLALQQSRVVRLTSVRAPRRVVGLRRVVRLRREAGLRRVI